jgi:WD40 repeat protein
MFRKDGKVLLSASASSEADGNGNYGHVRGWDVTTRRPHAPEVATPHGAAALALSPDGKLAAVTTGGILQGGFRVEPGDLCLFDARTAKLKATVRTPWHSLQAVAFSPDGKTLAGGSSNFDDRGRPMTGGMIRLWKVADLLEAFRGAGPGILTLKGHRGLIRALAFAPNGKLLAAASAEAPPPGRAPRGDVKLWDLTTGKEKASLSDHGGKPWCVAFSPNGKLVASGGGDGVIRLLDLARGKEIGTLNGHKGIVVALAFSPDGKTLASGGGDPGVLPTPGELKLWDVVGCKEIATLAGHEMTVMTVAFAPLGARLASGGQDGVICLWDLERGAKPEARPQPAPAPDAGPPNNRTRSPDREGHVATIRPATDAEKKDGILAVLTLGGRKGPILVTRKTELQFAKGKLVEEATPASFVKGDHISVWLPGGPQNITSARAELIIIFRPGRPPDDK